MGVTKEIISEGSGASPSVGDKVTIQYTGWLKDDAASNGKGKHTNADVAITRFDSSVGRGPFVVDIGVGQVIKGWDEGVTQMKLGEKATLHITPDFGYGSRDVELQKIEKK
ncbi:FK506-binding protein [Lachnellula suecica]|uniref:peptidylprolyl isomerase n=1 Tax=Lachnellula suecica TaxID=602035 RepID=A0A8T9CJQ0_9HELO|nr:FK506-binding protein [Lachnellula suecica]